MKTTETEKEVINVIKNRWKLGRSKYGVGISFTQHKNIEGWLNEAIEEAADMLQYLVAMKMHMNKNKKEKKL